jgi:hypothetical protein
MERNQRQPSKTSISSKSGNEKQAFSVCNALSGVEFSKGLRSYDKPPVSDDLIYTYYQLNLIFVF